MARRFLFCSCRILQIFVTSCLIIFLFNLALIYYRVDYSRTLVSNDEITADDEIIVIKPEARHEDVTEIAIFDENSLDVKCNLTLEYAVKSIKRAKTEECRQKLETLGCILQTGRLLHPVSLPRQCPLSNPNGEGYWFGCFHDNKTNRILTAAVFDLPETNSPENCIYHCLRIGQEVAGLEFGKECYCGSKLMLQGVETLPEEKCDVFACPGFSAETCGGQLALSVYKTGLGSITNIPVKYVSPSTISKRGAKPARIAFLLQFNGRAVRQVKRMLKLIYRREHFYYVHVDSRQDYMYREMLKLETTIPDNFKVKRNRYSTIWGGASLLTMMLDSAKDLLEMDRFDYLINLSEADMPLMSVEELQALLTKYSGVNFLKSHGNATARFLKKQGLEKVFFECEHRMWRLGDRQLPDKIRIDGGSDWFALHRTFLEYAVHSEDKLVKGLKQMFKYALLPAESFFHTLAANSVFCVRTSNTHLKLIYWKRKQGCKCQYKHIVDWCGCSPNVIRTDDFDLDRFDRPSIQSHLQYTSRKFEAIIDQSAIAYVESELRNRSPMFKYFTKSSNVSISGFTSYWQNDYDKLDSKSSLDYRLVLFDSLARSAIDRFLCTKECRLKSIEAMNIYRSDDQMKGITIAFSGLCSENVTFSSEVHAKVRKNSTVYSNSHYLASNLEFIEVGTDFDLKEEIFRNYACVITQTSKPVLLHEWNPEMVRTDRHGSSMKVNIIWTDPYGKEMCSQFAKLGSPTGVEHTQYENNDPSSIGDPLAVGIWNVRILFDNRLLAETKFLVLPSILSHDIADKSIDNLIRQFYIVNDMCLYDDLRLASNLNGFLKWSKCNVEPKNDVQLCRSAQWSSYYPDIKSQIDGVDMNRGILIP